MTRQCAICGVDLPPVTDAELEDQSYYLLDFPEGIRIVCPKHGVEETCAYIAVESKKAGHSTIRPLMSMYKALERRNP